MGKGVGKLATWEIRMRGGSILFEYKNLRPGRSIHFSKQLLARLSVQGRVVFNKTKSIKLAHVKKLNPRVSTFW